MNEDVRPDVVVAIASALGELDPSRLDGLAGITAAERKAGESVAALLLAGTHEGRSAFVEVMKILAAGGYRAPMTWSEAWAAQDDEHRERVAEVYLGSPEQLAPYIDAWRNERGDS